MPLAIITPARSGSSTSRLRPESCTASTLAPSHVLEAMGVLTHGNVRLSLSRDTGEDEIDRFLAVLPEVVAELRSRVGL